MKINKKIKKHPILYTSAIAAIIAIGIGGYFCWRYFANPTKAVDTNTTNVIDYNPPTPEQKAAVETIKTTPTVPATTVTKQPTASTSVSASISASNVTADQVQIRSIISGAVSSSGTCTLVLTNGELTVTKTSTTYTLPSSSTCQGFDVNRSELANGEWNINLTVVIGSETATANGKVTLQ